MKRLFPALALAGATLLSPFAVSAYTVDAGGFRWTFDVNRYDGGKEVEYYANIYGVYQIDSKGEWKEWDAKSLTVPATLSVTLTNEYELVRFSERVYDKEGNFLSNKYSSVQSPVKEVKTVSAEVNIASLNALNDNLKLETLVVPDTVSWVNGCNGCSNLANVTIGAETMFGGWGTFRGSKWLAAQGDFVVRNGTLVAYCGSAASVTVPDGVETIGDAAFAGLTDLASVTIPASVKEIGYGAFQGCSSLKSIALPAGLEYLGGEAFADCTALTSIAIPAKVKYIGSEAFSYCTNLVSVTLPAGLKEIESLAFYKCSALSSIDIPSSVKEIGYAAFYGCYSLKSIVIPSGVEYIYDSTFRFCTNLVSVTIPDSVDGIDGEAFFHCSSLASVNIPASVEYIGNYAFEDCEKLATVTGATGVEYCSSTAFYGTKLLDGVTDGICRVGGMVLCYNGTLPATLTIPEGVTYIAHYAFQDNDDITAVKLPSSLKRIGYGAFYNCVNLKTVTGGAGLEYCGGRAFEDTEYSYAFYDYRSDKSQAFSLVRLGGVVLGYKGVCPAELVIPDDVSMLHESAFDFDCDDISTSNITSVALGSGVKILGDYAFYALPNLKTVSGGTALEEMGGEAFYGCRKLESATMGSQEFMLFDDYQFEDCSNLKDVVLTGRRLFVEDNFAGCSNLVNVTLNFISIDPDDEDEEEGVLIRSDAFADAVKTLKSVKVTRDGYAVTGWETGYYPNNLEGNVFEGVVFANEPATFLDFVKHPYTYRRWDSEKGMNVLVKGYDYEALDFSPVWKRVLRNTDTDAAFDATVASTYVGWLTDADGKLAGTVSIKVSKGKNGASKAKATILMLGARKTKLSGTFDANGAGQGDLAGLTLTASGLVGKLAVSGASYDVDGARDVAKSKKDPEAEVFDSFNKNVLTLALAPKYEEDCEGFANGFSGISVTLGKKGKAKVAGVMSDGSKVSLSVQAVLGDYACCVPVLYSKSKGSVGFLAWFDRTTGEALEITGLGAWTSKDAGEVEMDVSDYANLAPVAASTGFFVEREDLPASLAATALPQFLPNGEPVTVSARKWELAKGASIKYKKGEFDSEGYAKSVAKGNTNDSGLKLKYKAKDGSFSGSFTVYTLENGKLKKNKAKVSGVVVDGVGYASAVIKKHGSMPAFVGEPDED